MGSVAIPGGPCLYNSSYIQYNQVLDTYLLNLHCTYGKNSYYPLLYMVFFDVFIFIVCV